MAERRRTGRLFWKLVLALWLSMSLSMAGSVAYIRFIGNRIPFSELPSLGPVPLVPIATATLVMLMTALLLAWYLARPVQHLRWALRQVAAGRLDTRVQPLMGCRRDEIADLAHDFDGMAAQLQQLGESHQALLHDISHELRSPLTRMQAAIGLLRQEPSQMPALIERVEREIKRLDALVEELLTLHRLEASRAGEARERIDIIELLHAMAEDADFEARASGRSVMIDAPGSFVAVVNGELVYRAFENVIRNAVKFTEPGTAAEIRARVSNDGTVLETTVQDRGPGVPPAMLDAIFEPFVRVDGSESVRGAGLGLAIAQRTMTIHGGRISAALRTGGGLVVTLSLPANTAPLVAMS